MSHEFKQKLSFFISSISLKKYSPCPTCTDGSKRDLPPLKGQKQMPPRSLFSTILYLFHSALPSFLGLCVSELWVKTSSAHCDSVLGFIVDRKSNSSNTCHARWEGFSSFSPVNSQTFSNICRNAIRSKVSTYTCNHIDFMSCWGFNRSFCWGN